MFKRVQALFACVVLFGTLHGFAQSPSTNQVQMATLQAEMDAAIAEVKKIVNQPVRRFSRSKSMKVVSYKSGWFHEGASRPIFNSVDVRQTRELPYAQYPYVTSDLNPGIVFAGPDLEFNAATKYFYTDYSSPKKKLTEAEMLEINRLYRVIGRCETEMDRLQLEIIGAGEEDPQQDEPAIPQNAFLAKVRSVPKSTYAFIATALLLFLVVYNIFLKRRT